jgi:16S rRNA (guanine527-N7)-methyltransferase
VARDKSHDEAARDDSTALANILAVSRETEQRLERFVGFLRQWQKADNLVAPSTLGEIWRRHVADSAQLVARFPDAKRWLDLGSGAGFPGLVIAILFADQPDSYVDLIESNQRKCAFLRRAIAETGARAAVHQGRIEQALKNWPKPVDIVTARALAPLPRLLELVAPLFPGSVRAVFPKGRDFEGELAEASQSWRFDLVKHKSRITDDSVILEISNLAPVSREAATR